jgi:hypothetical protein
MAGRLTADRPPGPIFAVTQPFSTMRDPHLMRYPCYMIYAPDFESLPSPAKESIFRRLAYFRR